MSQMIGLPGRVYHMDDILIWRSTEAEHDQRPTEAYKGLKNSGVILSAKRCVFYQASVKFLELLRRKITSCQ